MGIDEQRSSGGAGDSHAVGVIGAAVVVGIKELRADANTNGAVTCEIGTELFNPDNSAAGMNNANRMRISSTSTGALVVHAHDLGSFYNGNDLRDLGTDSYTTERYQLLTSDFSLPNNSETIAATRTTESQSNGDVLTTGYDIYTRDNSTQAITRHSFDLDGSLASSTELTSSELIEAEVATRTDLTGDGTVAYRIGTELFNPDNNGGAGMTNANRMRISSTSAGALLVHTHDAGNFHEGNDL